MKSVLFSFLLILSVSGIQAQSLQINNAVTTVTGTLAELGANGELETAWDVQNISSSSISVRAKRIVETQVTGSANYFCWGVCFLENTNISPVSVAQLLNPGEVNNSFYAHYRPYGNAGQTVVTYCFFETDNESNQVCQTVNFCVDNECVVSVGETNEMPSFSEIGPNPLSGLGKINYHFPTLPDNSKLTFYNMTGEIVKQLLLTGREGLVIINSTDFQSGLYVYSLSDDHGVYGSKKMIVTR